MLMKLFFVWWVETTVSGAEDSMETNEAAAALLNMESPNNILDEKRMSKIICIVIVLIFYRVQNVEKCFNYNLTFTFLSYGVFLHLFDSSH